MEGARIRILQYTTFNDIVSNVVSLLADYLVDDRSFCKCRDQKEQPVFQYLARLTKNFLLRIYWLRSNPKYT